MSSPPRMFRVLTLLVLSATSIAQAETWDIYPPAPALYGKRAQLQLVAERTAGPLHQDVTGKATFRSLNPEILQVTSQGLVTPVANGTGQVEITLGNEKTTVAVKVDRADVDQPWSFREDVQAVLTKTGCNMGACHGAQAGKKGFKLTLRGYDPFQDHDTLVRQSKGRRVSLADPGRSLILLKGTGTIPHGGGVRFTPDSQEYRIVSEWIAEGGAPPKAEDAAITKLEIFPKQVTLAPEGTQHFSVCATYSDGRTRDVTRWAKYNSTEAGVAAIDEAGEVKVTGKGESSITAWYGSKVTVATVSIPYPRAIPEEVFTKAEKKNLIDDLVLAKLQRLRIPPSGKCTDGEFLRRAYLDSLGVLPSVSETQAFLANTAPDKRDRLIDSLLKRPEYVDYWSYQWADLLLLNSNRLHPSAVWAFSRWIRDSVSSNKPWDKFARDIITASGSTLENGAANFFVLHKDPQELNETACSTFLGLSIGCAKCHDHPLERWTQDDYYSMSNLLARVQQKAGSQEGDIVVFPTPNGDVRHPIRTSTPPPRPLDGEALPLDSTADRREHLARWLTSPQNPYFARAIVNKIWANYLGRGLVESVDDLRATNPASNEELLNALAQDFVKHNYDIQYLIRLIMNSATYQRSAIATADNKDDDRFYSHYLMKRMSAEVLLDALSQVTEVPTSYPGYPAGYRALQLPDSNVSSYFLTAFGRPSREFPCACERSDDANVTQSLHLSNGETLNDKIKATNSIVERFLKEKKGDAETIESLYLAAFCRRPTADEMKNLVAILASAKGKTEAETLAERKLALQDLLWATLSSKEFLFVQ